MLKYSCILLKREYRSPQTSRLLSRYSWMANRFMMLEISSFRQQLISFGYRMSSTSWRKSRILQRTFSTRLLTSFCAKNTPTSTLNFKKNIKVLIITINWLKIWSTTLPDSNKWVSKQAQSRIGAPITPIITKLSKPVVCWATTILSSCLTIWLIELSCKVLLCPLCPATSALAPWRRALIAALKSNWVAK